MTQFIQYRTGREGAGGRERGRGREGEREREGGRVVASDSIG